MTISRVADSITRTIAGAAILTSLFAAWASAATVTVAIELTDLQPDAQGVFIVEPGAEVAYTLTAQVTPDENDDEGIVVDGLAFFSLTIETDFGVDQLPLDEFTPIVAQNFVIVPILGTVEDDDIVQIGGGQNTIGGAGVNGIGLEFAQTIGAGRFLVPDTERDSTVSISPPDSSANVLISGGIQRVAGATLVADPPIVIRTSNTPPDDGNDDDDDDMMDDDDMDGDGDDAPDFDFGFDFDLPTISLDQGLLMGVAGLAVLLGAGLLLGPLGLLVGVMLVPLLGLLMIMSGQL